MAFWKRKEEPRGERLDQVSPSTTRQFPKAVADSCPRKMWGGVTSCDKCGAVNCDKRR